MERLWAPWRMTYIEKQETGGCIFCDKPALEDEEGLVVMRGDLAVMMLNKFPYNNGHLLIAPYKHTACLSDLDSDERLEMMNLVEFGTQLLTDIAHPDGFNIGANLGLVAGAGVADHLHFHIVPRWNGDTNFMPVVADVKVLPEALESVRTKLVAALAARQA